MSSKLLTRVFATSLETNSFLTVAVDFPGGKGILVIEGLTLTGGAVMQPHALIDTHGQNLSPQGVFSVSTFTLDGAYNFVLPPCRLSLLFEASSTGTLAFSQISLYGV
jgi:hypothetical protein